MYAIYIDSPSGLTWFFEFICRTRTSFRILNLRGLFLVIENSKSKIIFNSYDWSDYIAQTNITKKVYFQQKGTAEERGETSLFSYLPDKLSFKLVHFVTNSHHRRFKIEFNLDENVNSNKENGLAHAALGRSDKKLLSGRRELFSTECFFFLPDLRWY